jgi:hypothetical protein
MNAITPHIFEDNLVRSIIRNQEPWFVGSDVARALGHRDAANAFRSLDDDEKGTHIVSTPGGEQTVIIVSEPGVFRLIFTSRKPEAERFKRWLAHEVLPALRRDGHFAMPGQPREAASPFAIAPGALAESKFRLDLVAECRKLHGHESARALWKELGLPLPSAQDWPAHDRPIAAARACLEDILTARPGGRAGEPVHHLIDRAEDDDDQAIAALKGMGIVVVEGGIVVANISAFLEKFFEGSEMAKGKWRYWLRRLPGARCDGRSRRYGAIMSRGTFVPSEQLDPLRFPADSALDELNP